MKIKRIKQGRGKTVFAPVAASLLAAFASPAVVFASAVDRVSGASNAFIAEGQKFIPVFIGIILFVIGVVILIKGRGGAQEAKEGALARGIGLICAAFAIPIAQLIWGLVSS